MYLINKDSWTASQNKWWKIFHLRFAANLYFHNFSFSRFAKVDYIQKIVVNIIELISPPEIFKFSHSFQTFEHRPLVLLNKSPSFRGHRLLLVVTFTAFSCLYLVIVIVSHDLLLLDEENFDRICEDRPGYLVETCLRSQTTRKIANHLALFPSKPITHRVKHLTHFI